MDADDLIDPRFMVSLPLFIIGRRDSPGTFARVDVSQGAADGQGLPVAMLFTDDDLAKKCLANFPAGWEVIKFAKLGDLIVYLMAAQRVGLEYVAFDPGAMPRIYSIDRILDKIDAENN